MIPETPERPETILSENFPAAIYLSELGTQCTLVRRAVGRLQEWAPGWPDDASRPLAAVIADLFVALSALAMISKLLLADRDPRKGGGHRAVQRRGRLRELLRIADGQFPWLSSRVVRNNIEHMDERLDKYFDGFTGTGTVSLVVHVGRPTDKPHHFFPRWLDPDTLECGSVGDMINLAECAREVDILDGLLSSGFERLAREEFLLWRETPGSNSPPPDH